MDGAGSPTAFHKAERAFAAGRLEEAEAGYRAALEEHGVHPDTLNRLGMIAAQRQDMVQARTMLHQACEADRWQSQAHRQKLTALVVTVARQRLGASDVDGAAEVLLEAAELAGDLDQIRGQVTDGLRFVAGHFLHTVPAKAVRLARVALALAPDDADARNLWSHALSYAGEPARLEDFTRDFGPEALAVRPFVACFPKSGSTLLKALLCLATGFPEQQLTYAYQQNEEELYLPWVHATARTPLVTQLHCRATEPNLHIVQAYGIRPVVLVRDIHDVLLSYKEFYDKGAYLNSFFNEYPSLDDETRMDLVVDDRAPWYMAFYASWWDAAQRGRIDVHWLTYEELTADKRRALAGVLDFYGLPTDPAAIDAAVAAAEDRRTATRFNKGVAGRGVSVLTERHKARIARLASYYPSVDFSRIGL